MAPRRGRVACIGAALATGIAMRPTGDRLSPDGRVAERRVGESVPQRILRQVEGRTR